MALTSPALAVDLTSGPDPRHWPVFAQQAVELHVATGMIMVHLGVDPQQALARLRAHAFAHGRTVTEAALDVIDGRARFEAS